MPDHWNARAANRACTKKQNERMTFDGFLQSVRKGWEAFGAALRRDIENELLEKENSLGSGLNEEVSMTEPVNYGVQGLSEGDMFGVEAGLYPAMAEQSAMEAHFWTTMDWSFIDPQEG